VSETTGATGTSQDLVITREFDAPRELVWKAWSEPEHFARWFGPKGFTIPHCEIDFQVGGRMFYAMRSPAGQQVWATGVFKEIVPLERIVFTDSFADEHGKAVPATHYGMSEAYPLEMLITVTFEEDGRSTRMTLRHSGLPSLAETGGGEGEGWSESFEKLAEYLAEVS
jgi:uncharacterized protein YndB with AHSA1/START domain